ncbi:hypothetical protein LJB92_02000 [Bacteroidales bacterium OttesenSCG-928-M06]|nr:hypothetical protein [Bacteroidales bacterium OttesenSCG-928-M06]
MKEIISVGIQVPSNDIDFYEINNRVALSDADIIVFSPMLSYNHYYEDKDYLGKTCYNENYSFQLKENFTHWKRELNLAFEKGKTVFIFLSEKKEFYIHTGTRDVSGTGRNQKITNHVTLFDNYKCFPYDLNIQSVSGKKVYCQSPIFQNFYNVFQKELFHEAFISSDAIKEFHFTTKNRDRCLGTILKFSKGNAVFLPMLDWDKYWTPNGNLSKAGDEFGKRLISNLVEIDKALRLHTDKTPKPDWLSSENYELEATVKTRKAIQSNFQKIKKIQAENKKLEEVLVEQNSLLDLLFEGGKALENAVIKALQILGYSAENYDDGVLELDQVIISPENDRFVGECEGKENKDIDISKFRQLQDALNEDFQREDVEEKAFGLLFGNPQRILNPTERTLDFTKKCKLGAEREKIGLIKTVDLFTISKYLSENKDDDYKEQCRKAIKEQLGSVIVFPELPMKDEKINS